CGPVVHHRQRSDHRDCAAEYELCAARLLHAGDCELQRRSLCHAVCASYVAGLKFSSSGGAAAPPVLFVSSQALFTFPLLRQHFGTITKGPPCSLPPLKW